MKKIFSLLLCSLLLFGLLALPATDGADTENILRLHIRAADDSAEAQACKLSVRDAVLRFLSPLTEGCTEKKAAKRVVAEHLTEIISIARETLRQNGKTASVRAELTRERFEYREYDGFFLPEGDYDALRIDIGAAEGHNWWCVIFPAACYAGATGEIKTDAEKMPRRFRLASKRSDDVQTEWWIVRQLRRLFR